MPFLAAIQPLTTSKLKIVKTPNFGKELFRPKLRITHSLGTTAIVVLEMFPFYLVSRKCHF